MRDIVLLINDIRSCHNVGSLLRTAEGLGVSTVYITGYSPYPAQDNDSRLPHIRDKLHAQIKKTALGAEESQHWMQSDDVIGVLASLRQDGYTLVGLEQTDSAVSLPLYDAPRKIAVLLGREVTGIEPDLLEFMDQTVVIPMSGSKESFNVVQAAAMALYHIRFT